MYAVRYSYLVEKWPRCIEDKVHFCKLHVQNSENKNIPCTYFLWQQSVSV